MAADPIIEAACVRKSFGATRALDGLDLTAGRGRVLGLLGPNGAGKTTLVRIFATLLRPDAGRVSIGGADVVGQPVAVRRMIGLAGQHAAVDETLTGRENLQMVGRLYRLTARQASSRAAGVLARLSLGDAADRLVRTYSGGMQRRLDVGATLVGGPRVLLLDEPATGLDPAARMELWAFLRDLVSDGTTILLTTQQLEEADHLADDIVIIDRGKVIARGSPAELKARLGEDKVEVTLTHSGELAAAARLLAPLAATPPGTDAVAARITLRARAAGNAVAAVVRALDEAGIAIADVRLRSPGLDEVFLAVTGQRRPPDQATPRHGRERAAR